jgi:hypothetical protein
MSTNIPSLWIIAARSEARKILEEKVDSQTEIINCLKEGYAGLALIIQTHLNIPIPPLVLPSQTGSTHLVSAV